MANKAYAKFARLFLVQATMVVAVIVLYLTTEKPRKTDPPRRTSLNVVAAKWKADADLGKAFASRRDTENCSATPVAKIFIKRNAKAIIICSVLACLRFYASYLNFYKKYEVGKHKYNP
ncbi:hypothetical protein V1478_001133 [Vespula squamosa]|uniref:Uncharacterized protein n=1 Tax=Vespula squamosa TaxID=30214 RepID=A0ABD2C7F8_VESSQ